MRIAVLNDIHGNLPAFEAALAHVRGLAPDLMVIAGDLIIGAPDSAACFELALSLGCPILRGNNDRYVADYGTARAHRDWEHARFGPMHEAHGQLSAAQREMINGFPHYLRIHDAPGVLFAHASVRNDVDSVALSTPEEELQRMFPGCLDAMIVRGHNHVAQMRPWGAGQMIVTSGSVGIALDGHTTAQYVVLDQTASGWRVAHQSVTYDLDRVRARFLDTGYIRKAGPMGRLYMREVMTGSHQLVPFIRAWKAMEETGQPPALGEAVERFLNAY